MREAKKKILVTGATGQVGGVVIPHLLAHDSVEVVAAARNPRRVEGYIGNEDPVTATLRRGLADGYGRSQASADQGE